MSKHYDVLVIGPVSLDHNIDYLGNERKEVGGAVVASGFAAARSGNATAVFTKLNPADADVEARFAGSGADLYWSPSKATCSIRNQYFTADKEKRACTSMGVCDPFRFEELPRIDTAIYHFAGLVYGDFDGELFAEASRHGKVAVDVQCLLRHVEPDKTMAFHDWAEKKQYLPYIDYLKTDAAEAEILTGLTDRAEAARLSGWGLSARLSGRWARLSSCGGTGGASSTGGPSTGGASSSTGGFSTGGACCACCLAVWLWPPDQSLF